MGFFGGGKYLSFIPLVSGMPNGHIAHWFRICVTLSYVKRNEVRLARLVLLTALQTSSGQTLSKGGQVWREGE